MRSIALHDVIKNVAQFNGMSELELVKPKYDKHLVPIYYALGMDTNQPFEYCANNLRYWSGGTGVGIRVIGELRSDREFINSPMSNVLERIVIAGATDTSLMLELVNLMCHTLNYKMFFAEGEDNDIEHEEYPKELYESDYEDVSKMIDSLNNAILVIRGNPYNEDGTKKTWKEYQ